MVKANHALSNSAQIFFNNLSLFSCYVKEMKLRTLNLKLQIYSFFVVKPVK